MIKNIDDYRAIHALFAEYIEAVIRWSDRHCELYQAGRPTSESAARFWAYYVTEHDNTIQGVCRKCGNLVEGGYCCGEDEDGNECEDADTDKNINALIDHIWDTELFSYTDEPDESDWLMNGGIEFRDRYGVYFMGEDDGPSFATQDRVEAVLRVIDDLLFYVREILKARNIKGENSQYELFTTLVELLSLEHGSGPMGMDYGFHGGEVGPFQQWLLDNEYITKYFDGKDDRDADDDPINWYNLQNVGILSLFTEQAIGKFVESLTWDEQLLSMYPEDGEEEYYHVFKAINTLIDWIDEVDKIEEWLSNLDKENDNE